MGMFDNLEVAVDVEKQEDKIGGGFAKIDETGFYEMEIKKAYAGMSSGGAYSVTLHLEAENKAKLTVTEYITSGTAKGCKNYYMDKNGKKQYLPGYNKIKNLDALLGFDRDYPATTTGKVMLWDRDLSKEIPQEKELIVDWVGKKVGILAKIVLEDKYNDEFNSRTVVDIDHFVEAGTGLTRNEKVAGSNGFKDKWLKAFPSDYVVDKRDKSKGTSATTDSGAGGDSESPF